jgi:hypothetical protein
MIKIEVGSTINLKHLNSIVKIEAGNIKPFRLIQESDGVLIDDAEYSEKGLKKWFYDRGYTARVLKD